MDIGPLMLCTWPMRIGFFSADIAGALKQRIIIKKITGTINTIEPLFMGPLLPLIQKFKAVQRVSSPADLFFLTSFPFIGSESCDFLMISPLPWPF